MRKVFLFTSLFFFHYSFSQTAQSNYDKCLKSIDEQEQQANRNLEDRYYEDNPDPKRYVMLACADHCPKYYCRRHHKQCENACDCAKQYYQEQKSLESRFQSMRNTCENTYKQAQAAENAKAERERKEEEERQEREEKARAEKEKKEKAEKEKAEREKSSQNSNTNSSNSNNSNSSKNNTSSNGSSTDNRVKTNYDVRQSSKALADNLNQGGNDFVSTIFGAGDLLGGSKFVNSNFGLNLTIIPLSVRNVPVWSNLEMYSYTLSTRLNGSAKSSALTFYGYYFGGELYLLNNKFLYLKGIGSLSDSYSYLGGEYSGDNTVYEYNYGGEAAIGYKPIKVFAGYYKGSRDVSYSFQNNTDVNTYSNQYGNGSYDFERKYGGLIINFDKEEDEDDVMERFIKLEAILEKPSLTNNQQFYGGALTWRMWLDINFEYFSKYPVAGTHLYNITGSKDQAFWNVRIGKTFTLFNGRY